MCEPCQSIVQYPENDPDGRPLDKMIPQKKGFVDWLKKIMGYLHISKLGRGHSGAIEARSVRQIEFLDSVQIDYETLWWNRSTKVDTGMWRRQIADDWGRQEALECAEEYSRRTVTGSLGLLRRFLELSVANSDRPGGYVQMALASLFSKQGKELVYAKMKKAFGSVPDDAVFWRQLRSGNNANLSKIAQQVISTLLGVTRQRENLCCEWADDDKLWTSDQLRVEGIALTPTM